MNGLPLVSFMNMLYNIRSILLDTIKDIKHNKSLRIYLGQEEPKKS